MILHTFPDRRRFVAGIIGGLTSLFHLPFLSKKDGSKNGQAKRAFQAGRRFVTTVDAEGKSCVAEMPPIPSTAQWQVEGLPCFDFWILNGLPASLDEISNPPENWKPVNTPPRGGAIGRFISWPPGFEIPKHVTATLDIGFVFSGQLELGLDSETVILNPGDIIVQRGTNHSWRVVGDQPVEVYVFMVDAAVGSDERAYDIEK